MRAAPLRPPPSPLLHTHVVVVRQVKPDVRLDALVVGVPLVPQRVLNLGPQGGVGGEGGGLGRQLERGGGERVEKRRRGGWWLGREGPSLTTRECSHKKAFGVWRGACIALSVCTARLPGRKPARRAPSSRLHTSGGRLRGARARCVCCSSTQKHRPRVLAQDFVVWGCPFLIPHNEAKHAPLLLRRGRGRVLQRRASAASRAAPGRPHGRHGPRRALEQTFFGLSVGGQLVTGCPHTRTKDSTVCVRVCSTGITLGKKSFGFQKHSTEIGKHLGRSSTTTVTPSHPCDRVPSCCSCRSRK